MLPIKLVVLAALAKLISAGTRVTIYEGCILVDILTYCDFSGKFVSKKDWFVDEDRRPYVRDNHAWFRAGYDCDGRKDPPKLAYAGCVANLTWPAGLEEVILAEDLCLYMVGPSPSEDELPTMVKILPEQCCRIPDDAPSKNPCWIENGW